MKERIFRGACTALITPFKNKRIDYDSLEKLIEFQIDGGISALLVSGTTGESASLSYSEHKELIKFCCSAIAGRVPLIAGAGSNDTEKSVKMTKYACACGADAVICVTPYYNKANSEGLTKHYERISEVSTKPIILYNVPSRTNVVITPELVGKLYSLEKINSIKEASSNISEIAYARSLCPEIILYSGNDDMLIPHLSIGADGIISVMSNIFPEITSAICSLYFEKKTEEALALYTKYLKFARLLFSEISPMPIKAIMSYAKFCRNELRLPLVTCGKDTEKKLVEEYEKLISE